MTRRILRTPQAREDLIQIWTYIAADNRAAADRLLDRIEAKLVVLAEFPELGHARDDLLAGIRYQVVGRYLLFYRRADEAIELVRVLHGMRDLGQALAESD